MTIPIWSLVLFAAVILMVGIAIGECMNTPESLEDDRSY